MSNTGYKNIKIAEVCPLFQKVIWH